MDMPKLNLEYFTFPDHTTPNGALPDDKRAQACWYFYLQAQKTKEKVGTSIEDQFGLVEDDLWMDTRYVQQAKSIAMIYQLESPDEMFKFWEFVKLEAKACRLPEPAEEYMRPMRRILLH